MSEEKKYKALAKLNEGVDPKVIAADLETSYATILRWRREFDTAMEAGKLNELLAEDPEGMALLAAESTIDMPTDELIKGATGLQRLNSELQATAFKINERIRLEAMKIEHISELKDLTDCLCKLNDTFFNSKAVSVNVQNNYADNTPAYGEFLSDVPGAING